MSDTDYPPSGFYFNVQVSDLDGATGTDEMSFQDVSGLSVEIEPELVVEGGQNGYRHRLPVAAKYGDLVLKRGYVAPAQPLFKWCASTIQGGLAARISPKVLILQLLGHELPADTGKKPAPPPIKKILRQWSFAGVWPTKWTLSEFSSLKSDIVIESLTFAYRSFVITA
ncbi:MAG TPA: phage tail protein [Candidatus Didemnitutus sp.]|nr:phage tail protein [Candidatus Didemnitutus sp.]